MADKEKSELPTFCRQLKLRSADDKKYNTDITDTQGNLSILQPIH